MGSGNGFGCRPACHLSPTIAESVGIPRRFAGEAVRTVTDDEKGRALASGGSDDDSDVGCLFMLGC